MTVQTNGLATGLNVSCNGIAGLSNDACLAHLQSALVVPNAIKGLDKSSSAVVQSESIAIITFDGLPSLSYPLVWFQFPYYNRIRVTKLKKNLHVSSAFSGPPAAFRFSEGTTAGPSPVIPIYFFSAFFSCFNRSEEASTPSIAQGLAAYVVARFCA